MFCRRICILCQQTSPKRWLGNMNTTSNCDVTNSAHQMQMTTMCHWMKSPHENVLCTPLCRFVVKLNDVCNFSFQLQTFKNFSQISKTLSTKSCHSCETTTRLLSVLRITLFHPSQKRGLECLLSIASVQTCGIEKYVCRNHVFVEFLNRQVLSLPDLM